MERKGIPLREHASVASLADGQFAFSVPWSPFTAIIEAEDLDSAHRNFGLQYMQVLSSDQAERDALAEYLKDHGI